MEALYSKEVEELNERLGEGLTPELPYEVWEDRIRRCRALMERDGFDALIVYSGAPAMAGAEWLRYLANVAASIWSFESFVVIPLKGELTLLINMPPSLEPTRDMSLIKDVRLYLYSEEKGIGASRYSALIPALRTILTEKGVEKGKIGLACQGVQGDYSPALLHPAIKEACPQIEDASELLWELIEVKTDYDIKMARKSAEINGKALVAALDCLAEGGKRESDALFAFLETALKEGAEFPGMTTMNFWHFYIQSGKRFQSYWWKASKPKRGEVVYLDTGICYRGYSTDIARNAVVGKPSEEQRRANEACLEGHMEMLAALKPGIAVPELIKVYTDAIDKRGFPERWVIYGHGTGLFKNQRPFITPANTDIIKENQIVNLETCLPTPSGVYSFEDPYLVTKDGAEWLTKDLPRKLWVIPAP